jgi:hypothetical protein
MSEGMKFKIHFTVNNCDDEFIVSGDNMVEIKAKVEKFFFDRNLVATECSAWSEEL